VARFLLAGASAVQVATVAWTEGPAGLRRVLTELEEYLEAAGLAAAAVVGEAADAALTYTEAATGRRS
jgi:dihydroorotate dehydrogenase